MSDGENTKQIETLADERFLIFVRKKAERMVTALYLVTDLLSDKEPLKWSLRHKCITMLGELLPHVRRALASRDADAVAHRVSEITSLLDVARSARVFSEMNANLLQSACQELKTLLGELGEHSDINSAMFEIPKPSLDMQSKTTGNVSLNDTAGVSERVSFKNNKSQKEDTNKGTSGSMREDRQERIVKLLQRQGKATMSDIKADVDGVSDKTLQRDVADLVDTGVLKRSGSKRWTNYTLL